MSEILTPEQEHLRFRRRVWVGLAFALLMFGVLLGRLVVLQVKRYDFYHTRAEENRIALVPIVPHRGTISDRNGVLLASNFAAYTLEVTPSKQEDLEQTVEALSEIIEVDARSKKRFFQIIKDKHRSFESVPLRARLTEEEIARFSAQRYRFPGVEVRARMFREYPEGSTGVHALGYISRMNKKDEARLEASGDDANYRGTEHIGKGGIERSYEQVLHGQTGFEQVEINAGGRAVRQLEYMPAKSGDNLVLTLDIELQRVAEKAFGSRKGALVAIDPDSGAILALVSMPTYDPNLFVDGISMQDWGELNTSEERPLLNRAIQSAYPPGSTFKPFMALAGLASGKRTINSTISDPGFFKLGNHIFRDDKAGGHGMVDLHKSIVQSCDTYYYALANDLGIDRIEQFMRPLGFGSLTGVDLEHEAKGVLPSPAWKAQCFKKGAQKAWLAGETISIGIGQGYNAYTMLQLASATATLSKNGQMYRPHLVREQIDSRTGKRINIEPEMLRTINLKPEYWAAVRYAMVGVNKTGTGARAFAGTSYEVAGKTGTAQVFSLKGSKYVASRVKKNLRDHALYIAFAPAESPKIALAVIVENGGFGAESAAPIARQVLDFYLLGKRFEAAAPVDTQAKDENEDEHDHDHEHEDDLPLVVLEVIEPRAESELE